MIFLKFTNMPCAVSGRKYTVVSEPSTEPTDVLNIMLNWRGSENLPLHSGHLAVSSRWSARKRFLHFSHWTSGSEKPETCPLASQTFEFIKIAESRPYMSSRESTKYRHHRFSIFFFSATP